VVRVVDGGPIERADAEEDDAERHGAPVERPSAADGVNGERRDGRPEDADHHQERGEPVGLEVVKARGAKDGARVDDDGGDARPVLHEHLQPEGELDAAANVDVARADAEEHVDVAQRVLGFPLHLHDGDHLPVLALHVRVVRIVVAADLSDDLKRLLVAADLDEPSWRLGHQEGPDQQKHEGDDLGGEAETPPKGAVSQLRKRCPEADPRRHGDAREVRQEGEGNHLASVRCGRQLGRPGRGDDDNEGHAAAGAEPGDEHVGEVDGACLEDDAEHAPKEGHPDALDASVLVREVTGPKGPEERAGVVRRDDAALERGLYDVTVLVSEAHALSVLWRHVDRAHDALAHALVRDGHGGHADDELEQLWPGEGFPVLLSWLEHDGGFKGVQGDVRLSRVGRVMNGPKKRKARRRPHHYIHIFCRVGSASEIRGIASPWRTPERPTQARFGSPGLVKTVTSWLEISERRPKEISTPPV